MALSTAFNSNWVDCCPQHHWETWHSVHSSQVFNQERIFAEFASLKKNIYRFCILEKEYLQILHPWIKNIFRLKKNIYWFYILFFWSLEIWYEFGIHDIQDTETKEDGSHHNLSKLACILCVLKVQFCTILSIIRGFIVKLYSKLWSKQYCGVTAVSGGVSHQKKWLILSLLFEKMSW